MKKIFKGMTTLSLAMILGLSGCSCNNSSNDLPKAVAGNTTAAGVQFGVDANINVTTIDNYLGRNDTVYMDMRMLEDPATFEVMENGDRFLSGFVKGFEVAPLPYIINVNGGLPSAVGSSYTGTTLFDYNEETEQYVEHFQGKSLKVLEALFPKDKYIFLMCGGAGYAATTKNLLISLGWNGDKIYNVGGYWWYNGNNNVQVKVEENGTTRYDFYKVSYHDIKGYIDTLEA